MLSKEFDILCDYIIELKSIYKDKDNKGKCFTVCFESFILLNERGLKNGKIVHSNIKVDSKIFGHAWIEYDNFVLDLTQIESSWITDIEEYYESFSIVQIVKYDINEILQLLKTNPFSIVWEEWIKFD